MRIGRRDAPMNTSPAFVRQGLGAAHEEHDQQDDDDQGDEAAADVDVVAEDGQRVCERGKHFDLSLKSLRSSVMGGCLCKGQAKARILGLPRDSADGRGFLATLCCEKVVG